MIYLTQLAMFINRLAFAVRRNRTQNRTELDDFSSFKVEKHHFLAFRIVRPIPGSRVSMNDISGMYG